MPPRRRALPPLNALRAFEAFGRHGRMTAAAEELFVTHGAISRQIRLLEQWLGAPLTVGPKTALKLTPEAERLLAAARSAFDLIEDAAGRRDPAAQELTLACHAAFAARWLAPRLPAFLERHPQLTLHLRELPADADVETMDGIDAAIQLRSSASRGPQQTPFLVNWCGPVVSPVRWAAMDQDRERLFSAARLHGRTWPQAWDDWARAARRPLAPASVERSFDHFSHALDAAAAGFGVAMAPWALVAGDVAAGRLLAPLGFLRLPGRVVLVRAAGHDHPGLDLLAGWLMEQGAQMAEPPRARLFRPDASPVP